jgi:hypothetical protein
MDNVQWFIRSTPSYLLTTSSSKPDNEQTGDYKRRGAKDYGRSNPSRCYTASAGRKETIVPIYCMVFAGIP